MWIALAIFSALLLGIYDVFKKVSLKENAVIPVLSSSIFISFLIFLPLLAISKTCPESAGNLYVPEITWKAHSLILLKSLIVLGSWIAAYFGMKNIPITIYSPIRHTTDLDRIGGIHHLLRKAECDTVCRSGHHHHLLLLVFRHRTQRGHLMEKQQVDMAHIIGHLIGIVSGLYDKHLMRHFDRMAVQVYSTTYQAIAMLLVTAFLWYPTRKSTTPFVWRWSILGISIFLVFADYVYFWALSMDGAMISIISTIRRSGAIVPFLYGAILLHEKNLKVKSALLGGVLIGVFLLYLGR